MCGIAGFWDYGGTTDADCLQQSILGMTQSMWHRGPDSGGLWIQKEAGMALGHRRLAIRDLSPSGHQPMVSPDGRYVLVYNGEIYNTAEIGADLAKLGIYLAGTSDTEVLLLALRALGAEATLAKLIGMFAFAFWDSRKRRLLLARDRFGIKPLYFSQGAGRFLFASEINAFNYAAGWQGEIDRRSLALYLQYNNIPAPYSIWQNTSKLLPGHYLLVDACGGVAEHCYWDSLARAAHCADNPLAGDDEDILNALDDLLTDSISRRLVSDVPVGCFLSGGIDSSCVTAIMQKVSPAPINTFCIGFEDAEFNEAPYAREIANYLGTHHAELYLDSRECLNLIPEMPRIYGEPFADSSQLPTLLLCRLARQHVTVALSGDGGDELFGGYSRYYAALKFAPEFRPDTFLRSAAANALRALPPVAWDALAQLLPRAWRPRNLGARVHNFADLRLQGAFADWYLRYYLQFWWFPQLLLESGKPWPLPLDKAAIARLVPGRLEQMKIIDTMLYLPDDILTKVDRDSMSCALEARVPILDHRVFELARRIPANFQRKDGAGKYALRKLLARYLPRKLFERPKQGFSVPLASWLRKDLRPWVEELLAEKRLREQGFFRPRKVREFWQRHASGQRDLYLHLWSILMFQAWLDAKRPAPAKMEPLPTVWA